MRLTVREVSLSSAMVAPGFLAWIDSRRAELACEIVVLSRDCFFISRVGVKPRLLVRGAHHAQPARFRRDPNAASE